MRLRECRSFLEYVVYKYSKNHLWAAAYRRDYYIRLIGRNVFCVFFRWLPVNAEGKMYGHQLVVHVERVKAEAGSKHLYEFELEEAIKFAELRLRNIETDVRRLMESREIDD